MVSYYAFGGEITYIIRRTPALTSVPTSLIFKAMSNRKAFSSRSFVLKLNPHQSFKKVPIEASQAHAVVGKEQDWPPFPDSSSALDCEALLESNRRINSEEDLRIWFPQLQKNANTYYSA